MINQASQKELAVLGGSPAFDEKLHVGRPNVGDRERVLARINDLLGRRWLTNNGPFVQEFEQKITELLGVRHCVVTCNATVALEIAIKAAGLDGEVIVPSFTFVATAHALQWQGLTPVFCDVDPDTHNLDPRRVEELITPRTTAIVGVHLWGRPCEADALAEIAHRHDLTLMFDAAHAFGCSYEGRMVGSLGDAEVFSFHATKFLNAFEGGAVTTHDDGLADRLRLMRNFGFTGYDEVACVGTNGKMNEASAAMGLTSLEHLDEFVAVNRRNYARYREELQEVPGVSLLSYDESEKRNYQYVVLEIEEPIAGIDRDELSRVLWAENVIARRYFYPGCHRMEPYRSHYPHAGSLLPATEHLSESLLILPTGTAITPEHVTKICEIVKAAVSSAPEIRRFFSRDQVAIDGNTVSDSEQEGPS